MIDQGPIKSFKKRPKIILPAHRILAAFNSNTAFNVLFGKIMYEDSEINMNVYLEINIHILAY